MGASSGNQFSTALAKSRCHGGGSKFARVGIRPLQPRLRDSGPEKRKMPVGAIVLGRNLYNETIVAVSGTLFLANPAFLRGGAATWSPLLRVRSGLRAVQLVGSILQVCREV